MVIPSKGGDEKEIPGEKLEVDFKIKTDDEREKI